jgi:hypothetical protein
MAMDVVDVNSGRFSSLPPSLAQLHAPERNFLLDFKKN